MLVVTIEFERLRRYDNGHTAFGFYIFVANGNKGGTVCFGGDSTVRGHFQNSGSITGVGEVGRLKAGQFKTGCIVCHGIDGRSSTDTCNPINISQCNGVDLCITNNCQFQCDYHRIVGIEGSLHFDFTVDDITFV